MNRKVAKTKKWSYATKKSLWGWIFVLPFLIGLFGFYGKIWVDSIIYSLCDLIIGANGINLQFNGFANYYYTLAQNTEFTQQLITSVKDLLVEVPILLIFSLRHVMPMMKRLSILLPAFRRINRLKR